MTRTAEMVSEVVDIAASVDEVFDALTDPRELAVWLGGDAPDFAGGWTPEPSAGSSWRSPAIAPDGARGSVEGEYVVVARPHRIETTWRASWDGGDAPSRVRFDLETVEVDGVVGTRVTVTHTMVATHARTAGRVDWRAPLGRLALLLNARVTL
jgi:uncharacterized protein YndB with AHSA1/START domain